jgi:8-hydroxy-5-deazaflavin:NADPH oxidoreductase
MDVAIIGTGNVGSALARSLSSAGHEVVLTSTSPDEADALAREVGGRAVASNADAIAAADTVILAVPFDAIGAIAEATGDELGGKILVDVTNRIGGEAPGSVIDGTSNAEQTQSRVPSAHVVKAFNTVLASRQADPQVNEVAVDNFVAGDETAAKEKIMQLSRSMGMRPIDAGPLSSARILEAMGTLNIFLNMRGGSWQNAWKLIEPAA